MKKTQHLLGQRVRNRLKEFGGSRAGYTQKWLAEKLNVSNEAVSKWMCGKGEPTLANLRAIALHLNCSIGYLVDENQGAGVASGSIADVDVPLKLLELARRLSKLSPARLARVKATLADQEWLDDLERGNS